MCLNIIIECDRYIFKRDLQAESAKTDVLRKHAAT